MTNFDIHAAMAILSDTMPRFEQPLIEAMGEAHQTPFHILIATILSLRTKDTLTSVVAPRLFAAADTPADRKSTRLNSSHDQSSYAVSCLKKKLASPFLERAMGAHMEEDALLYISPGTGYWVFLFSVTATPEISTLSLHDAFR